MWKIFKEVLNGILWEKSNTDFGVVLYCMLINSYANEMPITGTFVTIVIIIRFVFFSHKYYSKEEDNGRSEMQ